jgi:hypothetical protein
MKHTLTILFAIMLCGAKAQTPVDTAKALTGDEVIKESYPEDRWRQVRYSLLQCRDSLAKSCYGIVIYDKKNELPVDMMVRHYVAISYWD